MRALVVRGPGDAVVEDVSPPEAGPGQVIVEVERVGVCGTDVEFFKGSMIYLKLGHSNYPIRLGHEWCGIVVEVGAGVDNGLLGQRVTADTMLGCGRCSRCVSGRHHLCDNRFEIGIRGGWPGALAERIPVPVTALHVLPDAVSPAAGAMVEPGGNALRAVEASGAAPGRRILIFGPGTIGLLAAQFAVAKGAEVHVVGLNSEPFELARRLGAAGAWMLEDLPGFTYDAVLDATDSPSVPATAVELVEPGGRVVFIGLAGQPSMIDARDLVVKDVTAVGVLSGSPGISRTIDYYARGAVQPEALVGATVALEEAGRVLGGWRPGDMAPGPKVHVDPRLR